MTQTGPAAAQTLASPRAGDPRPAWPTVDDVAAELRLDYLQEGDDAVLAASLDAAIAYVTNRVRVGALVDDADLLSIPADVWQATVLYASRVFRRRDSLDGTVGWSDAGGVVRVGWSDADVEHLLAHWLAIPL